MELFGSSQAEDRFPPLSDLVGSWIEGVGDQAAEVAEAMTVTEIAVDIPFEMQLDHDDQGEMQVRGAPPTQRTETSVLPVWHQLRVRYVLEDS